ncbi:unnamed protein product [Caenorhabditis bovis]|uniref:K Homology domain-containing protein n=1 Tax=Caenorhabditis bovis TaxID=2654633 RepID=A0A8S1F7B5_9PELO|nr:unnamed protein product [Caenorhabditis bovis]
MLEFLILITFHILTVLIIPLCGKKQEDETAAAVAQETSENRFINFAATERILALYLDHLRSVNPVEFQKHRLIDAGMAVLHDVQNLLKQSQFDDELIAIAIIHFLADYHQIKINMGNETTPWYTVFSKNANFDDLNRRRSNKKTKKRRIMNASKEKKREHEENAGGALMSSLAGLRIADGMHLLTPPPSEDKGTSSQKSSSDHSNHQLHQHDEKNYCDTASYIDCLKEERDQLAQYTDGLTHVFALIDKEIKRVGQKVEKTATPANGILSETIPIPVDLYPNYNFVGRLLGPRGTTAKQLEEITGCKIVVHGRKKDAVGNESAASTPNPDDPLRVEVSCPATDIGAAQKLEVGVNVIKVILQPPADGQDDLKRQQLTDLAYMNGTYRPRSHHAQHSTASGDYPGAHHFQSLLPFAYRIPAFADCKHEVFLKTLLSLGLPPTSVVQLMYNQQKECDIPKCSVLRSLIEHNVPLSHKYDAPLSGVSKMPHPPKFDELLNAMQWYDLMSRTRQAAEAHLSWSTPEAFLKFQESQKAQEVSSRMCASMGPFGCNPRQSGGSSKSSTPRANVTHLAEKPKSAKK